MDNKTILICDDSRLARNRAKRFIKEFENIEIQEASDGAAALNAITSNNFDCVVLDVLMPNLNGIEVVSMMRKQNINTPVIIVTADSQPSTINRCRSLNVVDILHKPLNEKQFTDTLFSIIKPRNNDL